MKKILLIFGIVLITMVGYGQQNRGSGWYYPNGSNKVKLFKVNKYKQAKRKTWRKAKRKSQHKTHRPHNRTAKHNLRVRRQRSCWAYS